MRRGFTLVEVVMVVVLLAIVVPPTLGWMSDTAATRADAVNITRATMLATIVLETVTADVSSPAPGFGFAALADGDTYLDAPTTGLHARVAAWTAPYEALGMSYVIKFSNLVGPSGAATGNAATDVFRVVMVQVSTPSASGSTMTMQFSTMVTEL